MQSSTNRFWSAAEEAYSATYVNDRNAAWTYNASGDVTDDTMHHVCNSAGYQVEATDNCAFEIGQGYDGDGLPLKREENRPAPLAPTVFSDVMYYLRSSVLGGRVVVELTAQGGRKNSYAYANGEEIARYDGQTANLLFTMRNPVTGCSAYQQLDPTSTFLGFDDPYLKHPGKNVDYALLKGENGYNSAFFVGDGNPFDQGGGCTWNQMPVPCGYVWALLGGAVVAPQDDVISVRYKGEWVLARFQAEADGYQGYIPVTASYEGEGRIRSIKPPTLRRGGPADTDLGKLNGAGNDQGVLARSTGFFGIGYGQPQNPGTTPFPTFTNDNLKVVQDSIKLAQEMTKNMKCDEALKAYGIPSLAALINGMTPNSNVFDGRTSTLTGAIGKNGTTESVGAYFKENKASVGASVFNDSVTGRGSVTFLGDYFFNPVTIQWMAQQRAMIMLHEAVHQVGGKGDAPFGSSKRLSEKIIEKCYPVLKGKLGGVG